MELERRTEKERAAYFAGFQAGVAAVAQALEAGAAPSQAVSNARTIADQALEAERRELFAGKRGFRGGYDRMERGGLDRRDPIGPGAPLPSPRGIVVGLLVFATLLILAFGARAQVKIDDRDVVLDSGQTLHEYLAFRADVNPLATGTVSGGLREALASCPNVGGIFGSCVLQLRCNTTYTIGARTTWDTDAAQANYASNPGATRDDINILDLTNYDYVTLQGCGPSSQILYAGSTPSSKAFSHLIYSGYRTIAPLSPSRGSIGLRFLNFRMTWNESCISGCGADQQLIYLVGAQDLEVSGVKLEATQAVRTAGNGGDHLDTGPTLLNVDGETGFNPDLFATDVKIERNTFSMGKDGVTVASCNRCAIVGNTWDRKGVPVNDNDGVATFALVLGNGNGTVVGNDFDLDYDGDASASHRNYGIEYRGLGAGSDPSIGGTAPPQLRGVTQGWTVTGNSCHGVRTEGDRCFSNLGGSGWLVSSNIFEGKRCSGDNTYSCRSNEKCAALSKGTCVPGRGTGVMWNLAYPGCQVSRQASIVHNVFLGFDDYDESGTNYADNCPIKIQGPFNSCSANGNTTDPNDIQDVQIESNVFELLDPNDDGLCGDAATWASSRNTIRFNKIVGNPLECLGGQNRTGGTVPGCFLGYNATTHALIQDVSNVAKTSNYTVTDSECRGSTFTNFGASGSITFTLPTARVGLKCRFLVAATQTFNIDPEGTNQILGLTNAGGDRVLSDAVIGTMIELEAVSATQWVSGARVGTWTDNN